LVTAYLEAVEAFLSAELQLIVQSHEWAVHWSATIERSIVHAVQITNHRHNFIESKVGRAIQNKTKRTLIIMSHKKDDRSVKIGIVHEGGCEQAVSLK
jgi:hypothetical protein